MAGMLPVALRRTPTAVGRSSMPTPEQNKELMDRFAKEVFGNKNVDFAKEWLADDFVEHQVFPGTTPDKQGSLVDGGRTV